MLTKTHLRNDHDTEKKELAEEGSCFHIRNSEGLKNKYNRVLGFSG